MYINITKVKNYDKLTILYINIDIDGYMIFCSQSYNLPTFAIVFSKSAYSAIVCVSMYI